MRVVNAHLALEVITVVRQRKYEYQDKYQRMYQHGRQQLGCFMGGSALALLSLVTLGAAPAAAQSLNFAVDFDDTETNYRTYTHSPDPDSLYEYTEGAAIRALTDGDPTTNVELWYRGEGQTVADPELVNRNVGFTATSGQRQVRVSSVTASEWNDYGDQWLKEFFAEYEPLETAMAGLSSPAQTAFEEVFKTVGLGDPNVSEFVLTQAGDITLQTAGFFDLREVVKARATEGKATAQQVAALAAASEIQKTVAAAAAGITVEALEAKITQSLGVVEGLEALLVAIDSLDEVLQASEVAKVEIYEDGVRQAIEYAYTFEMTQSGFTAIDDKVSFSGISEWTYSPDAAAPEPGFLLGAAIAGGLFRAGKRRSKKA